MHRKYSTRGVSRDKYSTRGVLKDKYSTRGVLKDKYSTRGVSRDKYSTRGVSRDKYSTRRSQVLYLSRDTPPSDIFSVYTSLDGTVTVILYFLPDSVG